MFVKLWQLDLADRTHVRINTNNMTLLEVKVRDGVRLMPLFKGSCEDVRIEQWAPRTLIEFDPEGGLEVLVLEGLLSEGGEICGPQSWMRLPIDKRVSARVGNDGCRVWLKEGYLYALRQSDNRFGSLSAAI
jgi:hypothetical protein